MCSVCVFIFVIYESLCENCKLVLMARDEVRRAYCYLIRNKACSGGHTIRLQFTEHCVCLFVCLFVQKGLLPRRISV